MSDTMTPEQRSRCMSHIRSRDTKPEMLVRKFLFSKGLRYRVNVRYLPGTPDLVFRKYKVVVFVNGCFWHGHEGCKYYRLPKSNVDFWQTKIERNIARDAATDSELQAQGWRIIRVWECELKSKVREETLRRVWRSITGMPYQDDEQDNMDFAAETGAEYGSNDFV